MGTSKQRASLTRHILSDYAPPIPSSVTKHSNIGLINMPLPLASALSNDLFSDEMLKTKMR